MKRIMKRNIVACMSLCALLLVGGTSQSFASGSSEVSKPQSFTFQKVYGSINEIEEKQKERSIYEEPQVYGEQLKSSELNDYQEQVKVKNDAPAIKKIIVDNPQTFSGMYYDPEDGTIVVQVTDVSKETRSKLLEKIDNKDKIKFEYVKYSSLDITTAQDIIREKAPLGLVKALIPDVRNNKLIISLSELNDENAQVIKDLLNNSDLLEFVEPISVNPSSDETTYGSPYPMGSRISKYFTENGQSKRGGLSIILCKLF